MTMLKQMAAADSDATGACMDSAGSSCVKTSHVCSGNIFCIVQGGLALGPQSRGIGAAKDLVLNSALGRAVTQQRPCTKSCSRACRAVKVWCIVSISVDMLCARIMADGMTRTLAVAAQTVQLDLDEHPVDVAGICTCRPGRKGAAFKSLHIGERCMISIHGRILDGRSQMRPVHSIRARLCPSPAWFWYVCIS